MNRFSLWLPIVLITFQGCLPQEVYSYWPDGDSSYDSNDWTPPAPKSNEPAQAAAPVKSEREILLEKISDIETKLAEYGMHFETDWNYDNSDPSPYDFLSLDKPRKIILSVRLKISGTDEDIVRAGLDLAKRDELVKQMSDLWSEVRSQGLDQASDRSETFAGMKVNVIRSKYMLPMVEKKIEEMRSVLVQRETIKFESLYTPTGFSVWHSELHFEGSNQELRLRLGHFLECDQQLDALRADFLRGYIADLKESMKLNPDPFAGLRNATDLGIKDPRIELLKRTEGYAGIDIFSDFEASLVKELIEEIGKSAPGARFDNRLFLSLSAKRVSQELDAIESLLQTRIASATKIIGISWKNPAPDVYHIDSADLTRNMLKTSNFAELVRQGEQEIGETYRRFVEVESKASDALGTERRAMRPELSQKSAAILYLDQNFNRGR